MLARIAVHLPQPLWMQESARFDAFAAHVDGEDVVIHPPLQCAFEVRPDQDGIFNAHEIYAMLTPVHKERTYPYVRMDGHLVKHVNLLQIDIVRRDFRRESGDSPDPSHTFIERLVMNVVARLRYTLGAPTFREFRLTEAFWTIRYLADDGAELPEQVGLVRGRMHAPFRFQFTGLDDSSWTRVKALAFTFQPHLWERLYLDALFLLPEVGPALTLAISAIETATDQMIEDRLRAAPAEAERLIAKNSLGQRLDTVAKKVAGVSLKDDPSLWSAFDRLRRARNMAAHAGEPLLDGVLVTHTIAQEMILAIRPILDWLEGLMSPQFKSHRDPNEPTWEWRSPVQSVPAPGSDS
jgi:hypothetical protein